MTQLDADGTQAWPGHAFGAYQDTPVMHAFHLAHQHIERHFHPHGIQTAMRLDHQKIRGFQVTAETGCAHPPSPYYGLTLASSGEPHHDLRQLGRGGGQPPSRAATPPGYLRSREGPFRFD